MARQEYKHVRIYTSYEKGVPTYHLRLVALETSRFPHGIRLGHPDINRPQIEEFAVAADDYISQVISTMKEKP